MTHLSELLSATSQIVVTNFVQIAFFRLSVQRIAFSVDDLNDLEGNTTSRKCTAYGVGCHNLTLISQVTAKMALNMLTQYGEGSTSITLKSTVRMPPRTWNTSPTGDQPQRDMQGYNLTFSHGTICFQKVRAQVHVKQIAGKPYWIISLAHCAERRRSPSMESAKGRT